MGFREIRHTADRAMRVWARDLPSLFAEAARGLYALAGADPAPGPRLKRTFEIQTPDPEIMLVAFLTELVYVLEQESAAFDQFEVAVKASGLTVEMAGAQVRSLTKAIKAVTYHNLQIKRTHRGFEVEIVFDV